MKHTWYPDAPYRKKYQRVDENGKIVAEIEECAGIGDDAWRWGLYSRYISENHARAAVESKYP